MLKHVFSGKLKSVVDRTVPLKDIRAAHEHMEKSQMFGKIMLSPWRIFNLRLPVAD